MIKNRNVRAVVFVMVCIAVFAGGVFAIPIMTAIWGTNHGPTLYFWLLFGGGTAALMAALLLAYQFGYVFHGSETADKPEAFQVSETVDKRDEYAEGVRKDALAGFTSRFGS
ncbi:MAG: hypothetical protein P4L74_00950 [Candidatus Doudnabacteria bacterium]|nr:hypothetical protein [Candidatus Doudnabacteria bacterium]